MEDPTGSTSRRSAAPPRTVAELRFELLAGGAALAVSGGALLAAALLIGQASTVLAAVVVQALAFALVLALVLARGYRAAASGAPALPLGVGLEARADTVARASAGIAWATLAALVLDALIEELVFRGSGQSVPPAVLVGTMWLAVAVVSALLALQVQRWQRRHGATLVRAPSTRIIFAEWRPRLYRL